VVIREKIEFDNLKVMDEVIQKARICYQQNKQKGKVLRRKWMEKKGNNTAFGKKGNRGSAGKGFSKGPNNRNLPKNQLGIKPQIESRISEQTGRLDNEGTMRPPVQCWGCGEAHYIKNCPHRKVIE